MDGGLGDSLYAACESSIWIRALARPSDRRLQKHRFAPSESPGEQAHRNPHHPQRPRGPRDL